MCLINFGMTDSYSMELEDYRKRNGPRAAAPSTIALKMLEGRLNLESPGLEQGLRDILRVLVLARPLAQPRRTNVLVRLKLKFLHYLLKFGDGGDNRTDGFGLSPIWIATSLCHS